MSNQCTFSPESQAVVLNGEIYLHVTEQHATQDICCGKCSFMEPCIDRRDTLGKAVDGLCVFFRKTKFGKCGYFKKEEPQP